MKTSLNGHKHWEKEKKKKRKALPKFFASNANSKPLYKHCPFAVGTRLSIKLFENVK